MSFAITVPYHASLTRKDGWRRADSDGRAFHVVRLHYYLKRRGLSGSLEVGPPLADITTTPGSTRVDEEERACEIEVTDTVETVRSMLSELEASERMVAELAASASVAGVFDLGAKVLSEATERYRAQASVEMHDTTCTRLKETWRIKQSITIDGDRSASPLYLASSYRRIGYDVYLIFLDHLLVRYERKGFQLRPRRVKVPPAPVDGRDWRRADNVSPNLNVPVKTLWFWELIKDRCPERAGNYVPDVSDPFVCAVEDLDVPRPSYRLPTEDVPSLYRLSNPAFESKWTGDLAPSEP